MGVKESDPAVQTQNLQLNLKPLDSVMVLAVNWFLPQTERAEPGLLGVAMFEERGTVMRRNKTWPQVTGEQWGEHGSPAKNTSPPLESDVSGTFFRLYKLTQRI